MTFQFDNFRLDTRSNSLYFRDVLIEDLSKKSVQILAVLLERPKQVVSHDEIISRVWGDNYAGVTSQNVAQYIRKLRKALADLQPEGKFIGTAPNRGYVFERDVLTFESTKASGAVPAAADVAVVAPNDAAAEAKPNTQPEADLGEAIGVKRWSNRPWLHVPVAILLLIAIGYAGVSYFAVPEAEKVQGVVKESQLYESLVLYRDPKSFKEEDLDKYWTTELDVNSNFDRKRIRTGVRNLLEKGLHYGHETKCEQFEFQSVEIDAKNEIAIVKTLEKWFIAVYREDGTLDKNKYVGPYFVSYVVRNVNGRWLIEKSTTARANLPTPKVNAIEPVTEIKGGQQFFVKLQGEEFLPQSVYLRVVGEGCPEQNPCIVPNGALLKHSKLSETMLDNVPLTLAAGDYQIIVHNSETHASNAIGLRVE